MPVLTPDQHPGGTPPNSEARGVFNPFHFCIPFLMAIKNTVDTAIENVHKKIVQESLSKRESGGDNQ